MRKVLMISLIAVLVVSCASGGLAQSGKKKTTKKPAASSGLMGTAQMPGDNGKMNVTYSLRSKESTAALNFTLTSAAYTLNRIVIGEQSASPKETEKLLLLKFTVQNPTPSPAHLRFDTIKIMAVDSKDTNHESINNIVRPDNNKEPLDLNLKPAQKIAVLTGIIVPAEVSIPKLIVQLGAPVKVLRYDLRGQILPLAAPFADPSDQTGAAARVEVPGERAVFYPLTYLDVQCDGASLIDGKVNNAEPGENNRFLSVRFTLKNGTLAKAHVRFDTLRALLYTADKDKIEAQQWFLKASRDEEIDVNLDPGETYSGRFFFVLGKDVKPARVVVADGESHKYSFDVSDAK